MTAHPSFITARVTPALITCRCCAATLDAEDFRPDLFGEDLATACEDRYSGPVCTACMDDHTTCYATGVAITRDEADRDSDGEYYAPGQMPIGDGFTGYKIGGA